MEWEPRFVPSSEHADRVRDRQADTGPAPSATGLMTTIRMDCHGTFAFSVESSAGIDEPF